MTNAVIFAFGGAHLELGEHMLGKEYFPNSNLAMKSDLQKALPAYYDFMVAYQNLLRNGGSFSVVSVSSMDGKHQLQRFENIQLARQPGNSGSSSLGERCTDKPDQRWNGEKDLDCFAGYDWRSIAFAKL